MPIVTLRTFPIYLLAFLLPITMAGISIGKFLVVLTALVLLLGRKLQSVQISALRIAPAWGVLVLLVAQILGTIYSSADWSESLASATKYGKLLLLPLVLILIRQAKEAQTAMSCYLVAQTFVVITSWLLYFGVSVPWVSAVRTSQATVFSSYLDQAILTAGYAVLCWQMRGTFPGRYGRIIAIGLAAQGALNVFVALPGRTGQMCLLAALALHVMWALPVRWRMLGVVSPVVALAGLMFISTQFYRGVMEIRDGITHFQPQQGGVFAPDDKGISTRERLTFWYRSVQAIEERPLLGHGTGSWQQQYYRLESGKPSSTTLTVRNPHQEYLFWAVQLGLVGLALLIAWFVSIAWQSRQYSKKYGHPLAAMLAVCATACLFNSALYDGLVGDYFCAMLAILMAYGYYGQQELGDKRVGTI